jgi:hypothetical protein
MISAIRSIVHEKANLKQATDLFNQLKDHPKAAAK